MSATVDAARKQFNRVPGSGWGQRLVTHVRKDDLTGLSAEIAYHWIFAIPPVMILLVMMGVSGRGRCGCRRAIADPDRRTCPSRHCQRAQSIGRQRGGGSWRWDRLARRYHGVGARALVGFERNRVVDESVQPRVRD